MSGTPRRQCLQRVVLASLNVGLEVSLVGGAPTEFLHIQRSTLRLWAFETSQGQMLGKVTKDLTISRLALSVARTRRDAVRVTTWRRDYAHTFLLFRYAGMLTHWCSNCACVVRSWSQ